MAIAGLITLIATSFTALSSLVLAVVSFWRARRKNYLYIWAIICLDTFVFAGSISLVFFSAHTTTEALLFFRITFVALIISCLLLPPFVCAFLGQCKKRLAGLLFFQLTGWFFIWVFIITPEWLIKGLSSVMDFPYYPLLGGWIAIALILWVLALMIYVCGVLFSIFLKSQGLKLVQMKYVLWGLCLGGISGASITFSFFGFDYFFFVLPLVLLPFAPLIVTYGLIRSRLPEARLIASRILGYSLVLSIFIAVYSFLIFAAENLLKVALIGRPWFVSGIIIVLIAFFFEPFRGFIQRNLDRIFIRGGYEYSKVILEAVESLASKLRIEDLLSSLVNLASEALGVAMVGVLLPIVDGTYYRLVYVQGLSRSIVDKFFLPTGHPALQWLLAHNQIFIREEQQKILLEEEFLLLDKDLQNLTYALLVPLIFKGRLIGVLSIGPKTSKKAFFQEDINLLMTIAKQASVALENARLYQEIRRSERAVGREKLRTDAVVSSLTDGLIMMDPEGMIALVNPTAETLLDIHADLVLGKIPDPQMDTLYQVLMDKPEAGPFEIKTGGPPERIIRVSSAPVKDFEGQSLGVIKVLHDITRERLIDQMKSEFISIASHRLRTPLSAVKWSLSMLLHGDMGVMSSTQKDLIQKSFMTNEHMIHLVNDLLNVARIEEGRIPYKYEEVQIDQIIKEVISENQYQIKLGKLKLDLILPEKSSPKILADPDKIRMVFNVILDNAVKYTPAEGSIKVALEADLKELKLTIEDTGVGIPKYQQSDIFTKFFRGDNVVKMQTEGTGLGLFLARNIIDRHRGRIWFESQEKKGTKFFVTLPIKPIKK